RAEDQASQTQDISAKRGDILDRNGRVLAYSVDVDAVYAVPREIDDPAKVAKQLCDVLDDCSGKERETLAKKLGNGKAFAYVRRMASAAEARRVDDLKLHGVGLLKEDRRFYPN